MKRALTLNPGEIDVDIEDGTTGVSSIRLTPIWKPDGVRDTEIAVTQGDSADQLRVTLTGVLIDGDGSESTGIDTEATAGNLTVVSREEREENNQLVFDYVFDWEIDDTVDLSQPLTIDVLTTEALRPDDSDASGGDLVTLEERRLSTTLSYDINLDVETQTLLTRPCSTGF